MTEREPREQRIERVTRALDASYAIDQAARDSVQIAHIAESAGLSHQGVSLALDNLERPGTTHPTELARLVDHAERAGLLTSRVTLILSAGVFTSAFRAVLYALACAPRVVVRPSSRDPAFARLVVRALASSHVTLDEAIDYEAVREGMLHVYGRDETVAQVSARAHVPVVGKGAGFGVAYVDAHVPETEVDHLAAVTALFDQRGCLSPRACYVQGDATRARSFASALSAAFTRVESRIARGALRSDEAEAFTLFVEFAAFEGELHGGPTHAVAAYDDARFRLAPVGRALTVLPVANAAAMHASLAPCARFVTAIGGDATPFASARTTDIARMQSPPLDGPADPRAPLRWP